MKKISMKRHDLHFFLFFFLLPVLSCTSENDSIVIAENDSPNIIFIIVDDMGWDVFGKYPGIDGVKANTPTIDSLANNGITFLNFWVNPVCAPTRASLLTGKYGFRTGVGGVQVPQTDVLSSNEIVIQNYITVNSSNNYATALIGKWHVSSGTQLSAPENFGIQYYSGIFSGAAPDYYNWTETSGGTQKTVTTYCTTHFVDQSVEWINKQDKPFFLWLALNAPHTPFHRPPLNLISDQMITSPTEINANPYPYYLAAIEAMDTEVARLINSLSESQKENTVFIFMGDNGTPSQVAQAPFESATKGTLFQGGVNTPLIICGKNVARKNEVETALVQAADLFPTLAEISGVESSSYQDGMSMLSLCKDAGATKRTFVYTEQFGQSSPNDGYAIRSEKYKLIHLENGNEYFFDLKADPFETTDLLSGSLAVEAQENYNALKQIKNNL